MPFPRRLIQRIAALSPVSRLLSRTLPWLDRRFLRLTNGRHSLASLFTGLPIFTLTTTGARSGRPRPQPLLYLRDPADPTRLAIVASNWGKPRLPAWYYNLRANPRATAVIDGRRHSYHAAEANGATYDRLWQHATATFPGFEAYRRRATNRPIPIFLLTPTAANE